MPRAYTIRFCGRAYETIGPGGSRISVRMHLRGRILTKLAGSIVTRGPSVCDGAHVSDDGHERASARDAGRTHRRVAERQVRAFRVTTRLVLFEAI